MEALAADPCSRDFFHVLRRVECAHSNLPRIGSSRSPREDPVRLGQQPSLAFAPSTIAAADPGGGGRPPRLEVRFLGLLGPNGPMPLHLTEYARDRLRERDRTLARFLDIFHHRLISLFYRAWARSRPTVSRDRCAEDWFSRFVASLVGIGTPGLQGRDHIPDDARLHHVGWLNMRTRPARGLRAILADYFGVPADVEQFVGHWVPLPQESRCRLSRGSGRLGCPPDAGVLGESVTLGERFWDRQMKFRVHLGPLSYADYQRFLPVGRSFAALVDWVRQYAGPWMAWDLRLVLRAAEVPALRLGVEGRLGWTTWLASARRERDADDLTLQPAA
jgi:type VI secretion system protein ImpH